MSSTDFRGDAKPAYSQHSRWVQRVQRRYAFAISNLPPGIPDRTWISQVFDQLHSCDFPQLADALRVTRQVTLYRLCQLDCDAQCPLATVMSGMTDLAEFAIAKAAQAAHDECVERFGLLQQACPFWVLGMGKLGARELNVSSDIDLIFVYAADGATTRGHSHQSFFTHQVQRVQALLGESSEHGFVFRVDLALRPYGKDGALALSLPSLALYFQKTGREWERFAWLKSRSIAWQSSSTTESSISDSSSHAWPGAGEKSAVLPLRAVVRAFVLRRFLDHSVFVALRQLHQMIRKHAHPIHGERDVKLGRGGIREIEFAAQVLQIVRGGRQPELLGRSTLSSLQRLTDAGLMDEQVAQSLSLAYDFLRRVEHRIQYLDDQQTHRLPTDAADHLWLAQCMGFASTAGFDDALQRHRNSVASIFEQWTQQDVTRQKITVTVEMLQAKAKWTVQYLRKHPDVSDELLNPNLLSTGFDPVVFLDKLHQRRKAMQATGLCDEEAMLDLLRRAYHIEVFRILVRDVQGLLSVRDVGDALSALADSMLTIALAWSWELLNHAQRHCAAPQLAIVAYGKLGGKELGYGSDLDLVFLYDDNHEAAQEHYIALVRKLITLLTVKTGEGDLYDIDTALRPNGNSGLLVTSIQSFEAYQTQRGSNAAWTWEWQAMTRARCAVGSPALQERFDRIRQQVLCTPRETLPLKQDILAMREKLRLAYRCPADVFDIKHSAGGMLDLEFSVQTLVLLHASTHPDLVANAGNIALLKIVVAKGLVPADLGLPAADAYQSLRDQQHAARLQETKAQLPVSACKAERASISALWTWLFQTA